MQPPPEKDPDWLPGYRLRWPLRVAGDPAKQPNSQTVIVSLPRFKMDAKFKLATRQLKNFR